MAAFLYFFVIFRSILFRVILFSIFYIFLAPEGRFVVPNESLWGVLGHHFGATLLTRFLGGVQCVPWVPKSTIWGPFWRSFGVLLRPFWVLWGDILVTLFVCIMFCWFCFQDGFLRYVTRHSIVFREIFFYRAIVSYAVALILVLIVVLVFISV